MSAHDFYSRHAHALDGTWVYSRVTLSCKCSAVVANPQREITTHDPWYCMECHKMVRITHIESATPAEQETLLKEDKV